MIEDDDEDGGLGPAMRALNERQRAFVHAVMDRPTAKGAELAQIAGYDYSTELARRQLAFKLMHNDKVLAAIEEETRKRVRFGGLIGIAGLIKMASDPKHKHHRFACESLADRGGFGATTKHEVKVERTDLTGEAMARRIVQLAGELGVDPTRLLGANDPLMIEGEAVEVKDAQ